MPPIYGKLAVSIVVLSEGGRVLVSKRRYSEAVGLPGGSVETDDAVQDEVLVNRMVAMGRVTHGFVERGVLPVVRAAARRELLEETGLDFDFLNYFRRDPIHVGVCVDEDGRGDDTICFTFLVRYPLRDEMTFPEIPGEPEARWAVERGTERSLRPLQPRGVLGFVPPAP